MIKYKNYILGDNLNEQKGKIIVVDRMEFKKIRNFWDLKIGDTIFNGRNNNYGEITYLTGDYLSYIPNRINGIDNIRKRYMSAETPEHIYKKVGVVVEKVGKNNEEIIDLLILDTKEKNIKWDASTDNKITTKKVFFYGELKITFTIIILDELVEDEESVNIYGYSVEYADYITKNIATLSIYMNKNDKENIFIKKIVSDQLKLSDLIQSIYELEYTNKK